MSLGSCRALLTYVREMVTVRSSRSGRIRRSTEIPREDLGRTVEPGTAKDPWFTRCGRSSGLRTVIDNSRTRLAGGPMSDQPTVDTVNRMTKAIFDQDHDAL